MNSQLMASIAIVVALGLVGAAVVSSIPLVPQDAFADKPWGCDKKPPANCRHTGHKGN